MLPLSASPRLAWVDIALHYFKLFSYRVTFNYRDWPGAFPFLLPRAFEQ